MLASELFKQATGLHVICSPDMQPDVFDMGQTYRAIIEHGHMLEKVDPYFLMRGEQNGYVMFLTEKKDGKARNVGSLITFQEEDSDDLCLIFEDGQDNANNWSGKISAGTYLLGGDDDINTRARELLMRIVSIDEEKTDPVLNLDSESSFYIAGIMTNLTYKNLKYICDHCSNAVPLHTLLFHNRQASEADSLLVCEECIDPCMDELGVDMEIRRCQLLF